MSRALGILQLVTPATPGITASAVAARFGYSLPTAHRLLRALEAEGFLVFDRASHEFRPGPEVLRLTGLMLDDLIPRVYASLARLRDLTGESATLHWRLGDARSAVHELPSTQPLHIAVGLGRRYPLTRGAAGKALLSVASDADVQRVLADPGTVASAAGPTALLAELRAVRRDGVARSQGENIPGAASVAVPIEWVYRGFAALGVTGPAERWGPEQQDTAARALLAEVRGLRESTTVT
ncbi:IclR family transcriptional regulator [Pseudonocardia sp. GCM10023141]|uniref:IclR family transcriptional regulator n=1 Tax=Pseudonocardia sp. GCM10023141 TaxID=3252653 RepID=UPI00361C40CD